MSPALRRSGDKKSWTIISVFLCLLFTIVQCFPDPGKFTIHMDSSKSYAGIVKNMYNGTKIFIKVECDPKSPVRKYHFILFFQIVRKSRCHHVHFIWRNYLCSKPRFWQEKFNYCGFFSLVSLIKKHYSVKNNCFFHLRYFSKFYK